MINYARILKPKEHDNPSPICRATYLFSNVGDLVKCYGRCLRFPQDAKLYQAEMKLALGDVIMQCRLIEEEYDKCHHQTNTDAWDSVDNTLVVMSYLAGQMMDHLTRGTDRTIWRDNIPWTTRDTLDEILDDCGNICTGLGMDYQAIEHMGFIHVCERFEQLEREGWE